jgi:endoribonuclease LACTB2
MNIVNVGYDSTNYYMLADSKPRLLIDVGWPGTLSKLQHQCKRRGIALDQLKHFLATHYHPDHAGLAEELKRTGSQLVILEVQISAVPVLGTYMKPQNNYVEIELANTVQVNFANSRAFLKNIGVEGEIIHTPGHSDDSVTIILDSGAAFTGDLTHPVMIEDNASPAYQSWERIQAKNVTMIYPGHGPAWQLKL